MTVDIRSFTLPRVLSPVATLSDEARTEIAFYPGLTIMPAPPGVGKTVTAVALALMLRSVGVFRTASQTDNVAFHSFGEPRTGATVDKLVGFNALYKQWVTSARVVFIDSITLAVYAMPDVNQALPANVGSMKEGLDVRHVFALLQLSELAFEMDACVVATVNSAFFPRITELRGVTEGLFEVRGPGAFEAQSRGSGRRVTTFNIPTQYINAAMRSLGYVREKEDKTASNAFASIPLISGF